MKNLLFTIVLMFCTFSIGQNFENNFKKDVLNLLEADKDKSEIFLNSMSVISQNFYKNIQSEFLRNKYIKELDTDLKMDLKKVYLEKKAMVGELEKLFNKVNSGGFIGEYDSAIASLSTFYDKWYESQLQSLKYFSDFALIFDYCEFDYNPSSTSQMFTFYTQKCLDNYNSKLSKMTQKLNYDENLRTELKSIFNEIADFTEPNKIVEPDMNTSKVTVSEYMAERYIKSGFEKYQEKDFYGAISDLTKAVELDPEYVEANEPATVYFFLGVSKFNLKLYSEAIIDLDKSIQFKPNFLNFFFRGSSKARLNNHQEAIIDFDKSIEIDPSYAKAYFFRGGSKLAEKDPIGACNDWKKAASLGDKRATSLVSDYCN